MEKLHLQFSRSSLRTLFSSLERPDLTWKIVLFSTLISAIFIGTLGVLSYNWSIAVTVPNESNAKRTNKITATEIRAVIDFYKTKQMRFQKLLRTNPVAPALGGGAGIEVSADSLVSIPTELPFDPSEGPQ